MGIESKQLGKWGKRGQLLSIFLVWTAVVYGVTLYSFGAERDRNLAYTAMYMDDLSVDAYNSNASFDAVLYTSAMASSFCGLYELETRTLERDRYLPLCDAIENRTRLLALCASESYGCNEEQIQRLEAALDAAEPIAKDLKDNPPYYGYVLSYEPAQYVDAQGRPMTIFPEPS